MGRYDALVENAEFNLRMAKSKQAILGERLDAACKRLDNAEERYYIQSTAFCEHEKVVRSLAAKLAWQKRKNK